MRPTLTLALTTYGSPPAGGWPALLDSARAADELGIDRVVVTDHVVLGTRTQDYPWGRFPVPPEAPWLEPLTVLAAMAAATSRVRLDTGVLIAPLRPAAVLAKTVATLDQLSSGRVDLGVGTGWQREEFDAVGVDFDRRGQLLTDAMTACRCLWEQLPASVSLPTIDLQSVYCSPPPAQPRLPVWFSGSLHDRNVRRIVELGDGWIPIMGATPDQIAAGIARLRSAYEEAGRSEGELQVTAPPSYVRASSGRIDLDATLGSVPDLVASGVTDIRLELAPFLRGGAPVDTVVRAIRRAFDRVA